MWFQKASGSAINELIREPQAVSQAGRLRSQKLQNPRPIFNRFIPAAGGVT
jgi:hypothetical protein